MLPLKCRVPLPNQPPFVQTVRGLRVPSTAGTLADLPWAGTPVVIHLKVRKFFCRNVACPRRIFTERLPPMVASYHRQTQRLREQHHLALVHGGVAESARQVIE